MRYGVIRTRTVIIPEGLKYDFFFFERRYDNLTVFETNDFGLTSLTVRSAEPQTRRVGE